MKWAVELADEFAPEFDRLHDDVRTEILALSLVLEQLGPQLAGPALTRSKAPAMPT